MEEGISYYFIEEDEETKLVLSDAPHCNEQREGGAIRFVGASSGAVRHEHVTAVSVASHVLPHRATVHDYNHRNPRRMVVGACRADHASFEMLEEYRYRQGISLVAVTSGGGTPVADRNGFYRHSEGDASVRATVRAQAFDAHASTVSYSGTCHDLGPGVVFSMAGHPRADLGRGQEAPRHARVVLRRGLRRVALRRSRLLRRPALPAAARLRPRGRRRARPPRRRPPQALL